MFDQTQYPTPTQNTFDYYKHGSEVERETLRNVFGPDAFRPKSPFEAIKTVQDARLYLNEKTILISKAAMDESISARRSYNYYQADTVARALNRIANGGEEWEVGPYTAYYLQTGGDIRMPVGYCDRVVGGILFKTLEAAQYFIDTFKDLITALK